MSPLTSTDAPHVRISASTEAPCSCRKMEDARIRRALKREVSSTMLRWRMPMRRFGDFEWDATKAATNLRKHGVSFEEATEVFDDPLALDAPDLYYPDRFVIIGRSSRDRTLFVVHAVIERHERIRIISAREASPAQRKAYRGAR